MVVCQGLLLLIHEVRVTFEYGLLVVHPLCVVELEILLAVDLSMLAARAHLLLGDV